MCMVLYVASGEPLEEVPAHVPPMPLSARRIEPDEERVRQHFTKPHVYFLGSHTGCSCGFDYGHGSDEDAQGRESVRQLAAWLSDAVQKTGEVELYACWNGDESEPAGQREVVDLSAFSGDGSEFRLIERTFFMVTPSAR